MSSKVTVLMGTYNRPVYVLDAIRSVIAQELTDWELILMNDGGIGVGPLIKQIGDPRIIYNNFDENKGFAYRLDQGLNRARGEYIAYLGDDDVWFPNHLRVLVDAIETSSTCGVAYSDLWGVTFARDSKGGRYPLTRRLTVTRKFNREFLWHYNHVLHVAMVHRRDLAIQVGGYDPSVKSLIDWSMTRRLAMVTDFRYVSTPTGFFTMPLSETDRISTKQRQDPESFAQNKRYIKGMIPVCPKPFVKDVAFLYPLKDWSEEEGRKIARILDETAYPCRFVLMMDHSEIPPNWGEWFKKFSILPNLDVFFMRPGKYEDTEAYRDAAIQADSEYVFLATNSYTTGIQTRIIKALEVMRSERCEAVKWSVPAELATGYDCFMKTKTFLELSDKEHWRDRIQTVIITSPTPKSFHYDEHLELAKRLSARKDYARADKVMQKLDLSDGDNPGRHYSINHRFTYLMHQQKFTEAESLCLDTIASGWDGNNWLRLGNALQAQGKLKQAIKAYDQCLTEIGINGAMIREADCFPLPGNQDTDAFRCYLGLSECYLGLSMLDRCERSIELALRLNQHHQPLFLTAAWFHMAQKDYEKAERAIQAAGKIERNDSWFQAVMLLAAETNNRELFENAKHQMWLKENEKALLATDNNSVVG